MENDIVQLFISEKFVVLIPVIYILGMFLKTIKYVPDEVIPVTLLIASIVLSMCLNGRGIDSLLQGILVAGVAVFFNQLYKQMFKA